MNNNHEISLHDMSAMVVVGQVGIALTIFSLMLCIIGQPMGTIIFLGFGLYFMYRGNKRYKEIIAKMGLKD